MKKYKLIKEYPGSPKLNTIINEKTSEHFKGKYEINGIVEESDQVENYPEFWEELDKKEKVLTTEDGIDIFEGNDLYYINENAEIKEWKCFKTDYLHLNKIKYFSSQESADEYLKTLIKCSLSIYDLIKNYGQKDSIGDIIIVRPKELIQYINAKK